MTDQVVVLRAPAAIAEPPPIEAVYLTLAPAVLGYLRSQGAPDPEDLTSEVFVHVTRGLGGFRGDEQALRRWVFTIAHHRLVDDRRRRRVRPVSAETGVVDPPTWDRSDSLDPELVEALSELTPLQREVVVLRFVADLPLADVARIVRRPRTAVKSLQARALARLEDRLGAG